MSIIKAYYDRKENSIYGLFTIQEVTGNTITYPVQRRMRATSGQNGFLKPPSFTIGRSPIPYSKEIEKVGQYYLWLRPINVGMRPGRTGIGETWPISNTPSPDVIRNERGRGRTLIRLHEENAIPGTAGCIAIVNRWDFQAIHEYLMKKKREGVTKIPLWVL